jgi:hypothetical protein
MIIKIVLLFCIHFLVVKKFRRKAGELYEYITPLGQPAPLGSSETSNWLRDNEVAY